MYNNYNSNLVRFLNEMFNKGNHVSFEDMKALFANDFGVNVSTDGDGLYLFKYDMITVKWNPVTLECRGCILTNDGPDGTWRYVSRPPDKFFNLREGHCRYSNEKIFLEEIDDLYLRSKEDGTAIPFYSWKGQWKASTLGKIDPVNINDYNFTFSDLFWKLVKGDFTTLNPEYTYFLELCSTYNAIVTQYPTDRLYTLTARSNITGEYLNFDEIENIRPIFSDDKIETHKVSELNVKSLVELEQWGENLALMPSNIKNREGMVLYKNGVPVGKMKNTRYLALHRVMSGSAGYTCNVLIDLFFNGHIDDFYADLTESQKAFIDSLKEYLRNLQAKANEFFSKISKDATKKDFALTIKDDEFLSKFSGYFFENFENFKKDELVPISQWICSKGRNGGGQYERFDEIWKGMFKL